MDYKVVEAILRESNVDLRNGLNPEETLPILKDLGVPEKNKVRCILKNDGPHIANDEILQIVQRKPNSFPSLVASIKINRNDSLYDKLWEYFEEFFGKRNRQDLLRQLQFSVDSIVAKHLSQPIQPGDIGDGSIRSASGVGPDVCRIGPGPEILMLQDIQQGGNQGGENDSLKHSGKAQAGDDSQSNQRGAIGNTSSDSSLRRESSGPIICEVPSSCSLVEYEDKELNDLDSSVGDELGKELEKQQPDGKPGWELVLKYLNVKFTMGERKNVRRSSNPGESFLELLGDKQITIRQLKEALLVTGQMQAKRILLEERDPNGSLQHSLSENDFNKSNSAERQNENSGNFTSLQYNITNMDNPDQKPPPGIKRIISTPGDSSNVTRTSSSENEDTRNVMEGLESNDSVLEASLCSLESSASSSFQSGPSASPVVSVPSSAKIDVLTPREKTYSNIDASLNTYEDDSLKEGTPIPAVADPEKEHAALNPDMEHRELQVDTSNQIKVFGNTPDSMSFVDIQNRSPIENQNRNQTHISDEGQNKREVSLTTPNLVNVPQSLAQSIESELGTQNKDQDASEDNE